MTFPIQSMILRAYNKTALITGGTKAIGCRALEELMGFKMRFIVATRDIKQTKQMIERNEKLDEDKIDVIDLDVTNESSITVATKYIQSNYDKIDILINNVLVDNGSAFSVENIEKTFETNYYGNLNMTLAMMPYLRTKNSMAIDGMESMDILSVYASRVIFPFNRNCALNNCSKDIQDELLKVELSLNGLNDLMNRFKKDCIEKKWHNFGWIMNVQAMSIIGLNMFARSYGQKQLENEDNNYDHWIGSFCIDNNNTLTQNGSGICKLSTMLIDDEDKNNNGCLWGAFFKAATNIDVDDDDGYVDDTELQILDWINPSNTISWQTMLDDMMFSNVSPEDQ